MSNQNNMQQHQNHNHFVLPTNSISVVVSPISTSSTGSTKSPVVATASSLATTTKHASLNHHHHLVNVVLVVCITVTNDPNANANTTTSTTSTASVTSSSEQSQSQQQQHEQKQILYYYCYQDHTHNFTHTMTLLQRHCTQYYAAVNNGSSSSRSSPMTIHIANNNNSSIGSSNNNTTTSTSKVMERLLRFVQEFMDTIVVTTAASNGATTMILEDDTTGTTESFTNGTTTTNRNAGAAAAAADMMSIEYHDTYFTSSSAVGNNHQQQDFGRLQQYMMDQLLCISSSSSNDRQQQHAHTVWLQLTSDLEFQQYQNAIVAGMIFYFYTIGQWPNYIKTTSGTSNDSHFTPPPLLYIQKGCLLSTLTMDSTATQAIHLFPPHHNIGQESYVGGNKTNHSIYSIFCQHCCTNNGKKLLYEWFQQPLIDIQQIMKRQTAVAFLYHHTISRDTIRSQGLRLFSSQHNLHVIANTLSYYSSLVEDATDDNDNENPNIFSNNKQKGKNKQRSTKGPGWNTRKALIAMYQLYIISSQKLPLLTEQLQLALSSENAADGDESQDLLMELLLSLQQGTIELERSVHLMEAVIDLEHAPREYFVQSDYRNELHDVKIELDNILSQVQEHHDEMNEQWTQITGITNAVRLETVSSASANATDIEDSTSGSNGGSSTNNCGWQFRLPNTNDSKILQTQLHHTVTVHRILKNGVYFSTKLLRQLSQQNIDLHIEYDNYQKQIVQDAVQVAATYAPVLHRMAETISVLDVLSTLAHTASYSTTGPYCCPTITDSEEAGSGIILHQARHPCVELQESIDYIPNDYNLRFDESSFLIVTGPNMGGKSTYIRAVGAIVVMAQIGSFVPCTSATINICHHILARVGAGDQQDRGISTFMAEMLESSSILRTATKRSLIIIDELGRGTSTFDGYGLAKAISEYIVQSIGCITLFATHFHELTVLEEEEKSVKNCHVTAQMGTQGLTFLYEIQPGPCLESFGIQVAEMANVPHVVIQDAKRRARMLENFEYRSVQKRRLIESSASANAQNCDTNMTNAIGEVDAQTFISRFCNLPLSEILQSSHYSCDDEKKAALLQLLSEA